MGGNSLPTVARVFHRRTYSQEIGRDRRAQPPLLNNVRLQFQLARPSREFDPVIYGTQYSVPDLDRRNLHLRHFAIGAADESPV